MLSPPQLIWRTQPNFLYTLLLVNGDIEDALEVRHFMYSTLENQGQIRTSTTTILRQK
jgi:hypothetical protein